MMDSADRALLEETARKAIAGAIAEGREAIDQVLADVGWLEMLHAEPRTAVDVVFGALGATNGMATVLDDVVVAALGMEPRADLAVLLPPFGAWHPPGRTDGRDVHASGLATARAATAGEMLVVCNAGGELCAVTAPIAIVDASVVRGIDPDAGFRSVRVVEALDAALAAAGDEPNADTAALAKAIAGRTSRSVAAQCQQVLAGIGFTTDHPFHRFLKRTLALEGLFGSADEIVVDLGRQLLAARRVPTLIEL